MRSARRRQRQYITGIDGLRTLAVLGVIVYHLLPNVLQGGYLGVPLFLLISGYFVTYQISKHLMQDGFFDIRAFYKRRFKRLYPVLIAMLVLTTAYITLFARPLLHHIKAIVLTNLLWVYNWWEIKNGQSYFDQFGGISPFTHLWTLGVEAQFYLLWPLILILLFRILGKKKRVARVVLLLAIASAVEMALLYDPANINRVYYGTDTRAFSLLLGSWLGLTWPLNRLRKNLIQPDINLLNGLGIASIIITIIGFFTLNGQNPATYRGGMFFYSFVGMITTAMILHPGASMNRWMTNPVFTWVGKRSYGIYVYQYPVMAFYERAIHVGIHPVINSLIELVIIGIVSELSYQLLEKPLAHYDWTNIRQDLHSIKTISLQGGIKMAFSVIALGIALFGLSQPDHKPAKPAVQARIERNHQLAAQHNKQLAEGKKTSTEKSGKLEREYNLTAQQVKALKNTKVTAIGDSVMADAANSIQELMPQAYVDAKVGRQGSEAPAVISQLKSDGHLNKNVVLNLGTNGAMTKETVNEILSGIGPNRQVYWLTAHVPTKPWQQTVNREIKAAAKKHKNVHVIDWSAESNNHADWFADDNVHMDEQGNIHYTRMVAKAILNHR
ncbi:MULTISPECIES: acyltransferase family protein [Limosilactobacillus]|uniref:acyltransferase family protein n=1 Tax=Limosilactobacillus TaxID=2742598 RepID=UPI00064997B3|nr:acyltransferase family protein [Limosilactobacillus panis]